MKRAPSPALAISIIALSVSLGGTSYAAVKLNGKNLKNGTVAGKALKADTLTGTQIDESKLAKVPSAAAADSAGTADSARSAGNAATVGGLAPSAFVKGSANVITKNTTIPNMTTGTIIEIPGIWRLDGECTEDSFVLELHTNILADGVVQSSEDSYSPTLSFISHYDPNNTSLGSKTFLGMNSQVFQFQVWAPTSDLAYSVTGSAISCKTSAVAVGHG